MIETLNVIARRYACRKYAATPVPPDTLRAIAEAGLHAPSAVNRQPWRLVVLSRKDQVDEVDAAGLAVLQTVDPAGYDRIQTRGGKLLYEAPAMIIIALQPQPGVFTADMDGGIVAGHIVVAATALGLDSCVVGMSRYGFDSDAALKAKYIPDGFEFGVSILLGYRAGDPGTPHAIDPAKILWP